MTDATTGHRATLRAIIAAWQAKDIDGVLAHVADDIVWHYAAPGLPPVHGKAAMARLLQRFLADMHNIRWQLFAIAEAGDRLLLEGVDAYDTSDGRPVAVPYAGVLEFRDGRVTGWRDYVDLGVIAAQRQGEAATPHLRALLAREAVL
ncbi:nuclear transport factor 2 family protein [Parapedomonas caeni]